jgi:two-component system, LytTR family, sensor kinase
MLPAPRREGQPPTPARIDEVMGIGEELACEPAHRLALRPRRRKGARPDPHAGALDEQRAQQLALTRGERNQLLERPHPQRRVVATAERLGSLGHTLPQPRIREAEPRDPSAEQAFREMSNDLVFSTGCQDARAWHGEPAKRDQRWSNAVPAAAGSVLPLLAEAAIGGAGSVLLAVAAGWQRRPPHGTLLRSRGGVRAERVGCRAEGAAESVRAPAGRAWVKVAAAGWAAVALVWTLDMAVQYGSASLPLWWAPVDAANAIAPGVLLTPAVVYVFRRWCGAAVRRRRRLGTYVVTGVGFWVLWALLHSTIGEAQLAPGPEISSQVLGALAGLSFNATLVFVAMATLHESELGLARVREQEVRAALLESDLRRARTTALRARLQPHFLYNTLNVASGLMVRDAARAREVLHSLGELLRAGLSEEAEQLVPLAEEIEIVRKYVGIQAARFGDRLRFEVEVDPNAEALGVPPFILQPLAENAIVHGIAERENGGSVRILAGREGEDLVLAVIDDGPGFDPAAGNTVEGVGLGGTRARLRLLFGAAATLGFDRLPDGRFRAVLRLPAVPAPAPAVTRVGAA